MEMTRLTGQGLPLDETHRTSDGAVQVGEVLRRKLYVVCSVFGGLVALVLLLVELLGAAPNASLLFTYAAQLLLTLWSTQWLLRGRPIYTGERIVLLCNVVTIVLQSVQVGRTDTPESLLLLQSIFNLLLATSILGYMILRQRHALMLGVGTYAVSTLIIALRDGFLDQGLTVLRIHLSTAALLLLLHALAWYRVQYTQEYLHRVRLEKQATTDPLTGLLNRHGLYPHVQTVLHSGGSPGSIILLDLDHFKGVNDRFGHLIGDDVLVRTAQLLNDHLRLPGVVGRWGGEEFLIVLPGMTQEEAGRVADHLRLQLSREPQPVVGTVTASMGVAQALEAEGMTELLHRADQALYQAKAAGRDNVVVAA